MTFSRRDVLSGMAALATPMILPKVAFASVATRRWRATRAGRDFGIQEVSVQRNGSRSVVDFRTKLKGMILLFPVRYQLSCREVWEDGVVQSIEAKCKQNGEDFFVSARRKGGGLDITSTKFNGRLEGNPGTSTFFISDIARRNVWVSTQSGRPRKVNPVNKGQATINIGGEDVACTKVHCGGQLKYPIDAYFDSGGELVAYFVDALGQTNEFVATSMQPRLRPIWAS